MTDGKAAYCILGIENQDSIHYAMPVRNGIYDFLQLAHQVSETAKSHREKKNRPSTSAEYLSGFYRTDKLLPVVTLMIYFGTKGWDAPLSLKEMYANVDQEILKYVPDYKVNLIAPCSMSNLEIAAFQSSLKQVLSYIKYSNDKEKLCKVIESDENFRHLDRQAADVINTVTNSKLTFPKKGRSIDMCAAIESIRNESEARGEAKGEARGIIKFSNKLNYSLEQTVNELQQQLNITEIQAKEYIREYHDGLL